jgi:hypothetical protein
MRRPARLILAALLAGAAPAAAQAPPDRFGTEEHRATAMLLGQLLAPPLGEAALTAGGACPAGTSGARTLREDIAFWLADPTGPVRVTGGCEAAGPGREACRVTIGQATPGTERVWSRIYTFEREVGGAAGSPACLTLP